MKKLEFLRQTRAAALVAARSNLAYSGEVITRTLFLAVILYIFFKLWQATFAQAALEAGMRLGAAGGGADLGVAINGFTLTQMLWYLTITEAITMSAPRLAQQIDEDVRSGTLAVRLLKPMDYPIYCLSTAAGERLVRFVVNLGIGSVITLILVGPGKEGISGQPATLVMLSTTVLMAFLLDGLANLLIGLSAFWLEDTSGILLIYSRLTMILGGMLIPIELLPPWLQDIVTALPFPYIIWGPAHLFVKPNWQDWQHLLAAQSIHTILLLAAVRLLYSRALGRISAHGG
jgi:ABC-2 type transport system permease protein